jgi:hypothetical protein
MDPSLRNLKVSKMASLARLRREGSGILGMHNCTCSLTSDYSSATVRNGLGANLQSTWNSISARYHYPDYLYKDLQER